MSFPRHTISLLATLTLALTPAGAMAASNSPTAVHGQTTKHHATKSARVCWTSKHGKHPRRVCRLRARGVHKTATHKTPAKGGSTAAQRLAARRLAASKRRAVKAPAVKVSATPSSATTPATAAANAATIASVLATPCQGTELTPQAGDIEAVRAATLCLVNQERARHNELPLQENSQLEQAAQGHSDEMVAQNYFEHVSPEGETPLQRIQDTGYLPNPPAGYVIGENIAWGTLSLSTPSAIVNAWIASPEHEANILNSSYRDSAIGVTPAAPASLAAGQPGAVYAQEFGVVLH